MKSNIISKLVITIFVAFIFFLHTQAQSVFYYDKHYNHTDKTNASFYEMITADPLERNFGRYEVYYISGKICKKGYYSSIKGRTKEDTCIEFYENGNKKSFAYYQNGKTTGDYYTWNENGTLKSKTTYQENGHVTTVLFYENGGVRRKLITGNNQSVDSCFNGNGQFFKCLSPFEQVPTYPGGIEALNRFISENIKYPKIARKKLKEGKVYISFIINTEGQVESPYVLKSVSKEIDDEAVRVIMLMPRWTPAIQDEKIVSVKYTLPINFHLNR